MALLHVAAHGLDGAQQRIAQAGAALHHTEIEVAVGKRRQERHAVVLEFARSAPDLHQRGALEVAVGDRIGLAAARALDQIGAVDVVDVGGRAGVAAEQPAGGEHAPGADVLQLPEGRLVDHEQRLEARAAAVAAGPARGGLDPP